MKNPTRSLIALLAGNALLLLMTKLMFLDIIVVRGSSMAPSLKEGTPIFVNKLAYGLRNPFTGDSLIGWGHAARGDIVVFHNPRENTVTVKRCLAIAGDTLRVNGHELVFAHRRWPLKFHQEGALGTELTIAQGFIFVVGDNAAVSSDSRTFGPIPEEWISAAMPFPPPFPEAVP